MRGWYNECRVSEKRVLTDYEKEIAEKYGTTDYDLIQLYINDEVRERFKKELKDSEKVALTEGEGESLPTREVNEPKVSSTTTSNEELEKLAKDFGNMVAEGLLSLLKKA